MTFLQRFSGSLNLNLHYHVIAIEGVFVDRTDQGLTPRFVKVEPPSDADVAEVIQNISCQNGLHDRRSVGEDSTTALNVPVPYHMCGGAAADTL